jgi:endonuclease/exonuclease/phosphatase family metal-dependent hydrolase
MERLHLIVLIGIMTLSLNAQQSIMSYNIRYNNPDDGENCWSNRKAELVDMIRFYEPDILGIQEGLSSQVNYIDSVLTNYSFIGVGRSDGKDQGEYAAIFFNHKTIDVLESKTFWLSEKPDTVSIGWDAVLERIVTYGQFRDKIKKEKIHIFNCHFDHIGKKSREKSSELILELINNKKIDNERIAVIGDLNCLPYEKPIEILKTKLQDSYKVSLLPAYGPLGTFNGFNLTKKVTKRIDYILIKNIIVKQYRSIDDRRKSNLWLSDHLPVLIRIE